MSTDVNGRPYALYNEVKEGDIVETDNGITCVQYGTSHTVLRDENGLYFNCHDGKHYLDGQLDGPNNEFYMGLYKVNP